MDNSKWWVNVAFAAVAVAFIAGATAISGCSLGDVVKSQIPNAARGYLPGESVPVSPSHNESTQMYETFRANVDVIDKQWRDSLERSGEVIGAITAFGNTALTQLGGSPIAMTPIGGLAIGGLGFLWGLFIRKPGTTQAIDAAYDEGHADGSQAVAKGVLAATDAKASAAS